MLNNKILIVTIVSILSILSFTGCGSSGSNPSSPVISAVASSNNFAVAEGTGANQVLFNKVSTALNSICMQIRISGVPETFDTTATVKTISGSVKTLKKAAIPFSNGIVLAANDMDFKGIEPFSSMEFSTPIPTGAKIEVYNADIANAQNPAFRYQMIGSYTFRMDYNGNSVVNSHDIILYMAWYMSSPKTVDVIWPFAQDIWSGIQGPIVALPNSITDDLNDDGIVNSYDAALLIAWYQVGRDAEKMVARAKELDPNTNGPVVNYPQDPITWHQIPLNTTASGLNTYNLQVKIHGVDSTFDPVTMLDCSKGTATSTPIEWAKSPSISLSDGVILVCKSIDLMTVNDFNSIFFSETIPNGALIEIYNKDTDTVVAYATMRTLTGISLTPEVLGCDNNSSKDISSVVVTANYSDGSSQTVSSFAYSHTSGTGTLNGTIFSGPSTYGEDVITYTFTEWGNTETSNLTIRTTIAGPSYYAQWGSNGSGDADFSYPNGLNFDSNGNLWVADSYNHRVKKYTATGTLLAIIGGPNTGTGNYEFNDPKDILFDSNDTMFVIEDSGYRVHVFDSNASFSRIIGSQGTANGLVWKPKGGLIDSNNDLFIADTGNSRIQKFDISSSSDSWEAKWGTYGNGIDQFAYPQDIAIDSTGKIYVADSSNNRVITFNPSVSNSFEVFGGQGNGPKQFSNPCGITIDSAGNIYVSDTGNNRIQKFDSSGMLVSIFGGVGSGNGQFNSPSKIAINSDGKIFVSDSSNHRIQVFTN